MNKFSISLIFSFSIPCESSESKGEGGCSCQHDNSFVNSKKGFSPHHFEFSLNKHQLPIFKCKKKELKN